MTTFYADLRVYRLPDHHYATLSVEVPARSIEDTVAVLQAWAAGLSVESRVDHQLTESISASKRRGTEYRTLREAAKELKNLLF